MAGLRPVRGRGLTSGVGLLGVKFRLRGLGFRPTGA